MLLSGDLESPGDHAIESEHFERHKMELRFLVVSINWHEVDRFLVGESWVGSHLRPTCWSFAKALGRAGRGRTPRLAPPGEWPENPVTAGAVEERLAREMASVVRVG